MQNKIEINQDKTKCLVFHKGRLPPTSLTLQGTQLELVKSYEYVGLTFTPQLSFSKHLKKTTQKARCRIGQLFSMLPINECSRDLFLQVFRCYIYPVFTYGLPVW